MDIKIFENLKDKKVFITGHTGFKGAYLCIFLNYLGAKVCGYALKEEQGSLFDIMNLRSILYKEKLGDIRDYNLLNEFFNECEPDYVIHMAAQPLVLFGYEEPKYTYDVNVMGTVNLMECIRKNSDSVKSVVNVTTDKVYENLDKNDYAFVESDKLCGYDPYANSKSCSELVTYSYIHSFFQKMNLPVTTCRAGNVIGGGDVCENRIIPDLYRSIKNNKKTVMRSPNSIRPYQYVLEPVIMYVYILLMTEKNIELATNYNIGPEKKDCITTKELAIKFYEAWGVSEDNYLEIKQNENLPHEASFLRLDNSKTKKTFYYEPFLLMDETINWTVNIYKSILNNENVVPMIEKQIGELFLKIR